MKYLQLFILLGFIVSCSSTKEVTTTSQTPTPPANKNVDADTLSKPTTEVLKVTDSLWVPEDDAPFKISDKPLKEPTIFSNITADILSHTTFDVLLKKHVSDEGNVNYIGFKSDIETLRNYIAELSENTPKTNWTQQEQLAYWINAYNALTIDLIVKHYPVKSIKDINDPWKQRLWKLGNKWYNLNEIEHSILRKMNEPRIHFAIVCASFSCPKLQNNAFTSSNLNSQLTKATKEFLSDTKRNFISETHVELSKIFQWFAKDFKQNGSLIEFLNKYSEVKISENATKRFKDYNWDLNE